MVKLKGIGFGNVNSYAGAWVGLFVCMLFCTFLLVACGTPAAPKQTLTSEEGRNNGTPDMGTITPGAAQIMPIQVVNDKTNVSTYPGGQMNMTISTSPYALCSFVVDYGRSKPSNNVGVVPRTADANGRVSWTWSVDSDAHTGTWPLNITAILSNGSKTSTKVNVSVTLPPINVLSSQTDVHTSPGGIMQLTISTAPHADCTVRFSFGSTGRSKSFSQVTNYTGVVSFTWRVDKEAPAGVWPIGITVTLADGESISNQTSMTIL